MEMGACSVFALFLSAYLAVSDNAQYAPQPESTLPKMLSITWTRGPDMPQGLQDSAGGVLDNTLVSACGFCQGRDNDRKPGKYPRGFLKKVWGLDLANESKGWANLPEFPGAARQGLMAAVVGNSIYYWGGFSYSEPYAYSDGYRLDREGDGWKWSPLPELPRKCCAAMCVAISSKIYIFGGADYDAEAFYTLTDRNKKSSRFGAALYVFDTTKPEAGWSALSECPGTPRWVAAMAAVKGLLYVIGGGTADPYCSVVDNWRYDPQSDSWTRLRDLSISSGNFPAGAITFRDRYIILGGGYQYDKVANPDGTTRAPYGKAKRFQDKGEYYNDVFVYDVETGLFGRADSMPLNNNMSMMLVHGDEMWTLGGETGGGVVDGVFYGHHPELFLRGHIQLP
jgi:N-acetylneuraminic acid mutarotase